MGGGKRDAKQGSGQRSGQISLFKRNLEIAQERVGRLDSIDGSKDRTLYSVLSALKAGLEQEEIDVECLFEAYAMMLDVFENHEGVFGEKELDKKEKEDPDGKTASRK
ncbi:MAG TPA: hypothetical protein VMV42_01275 [archaeon]|nr:hypothetical protein [archaeon]